MVNVRLSALILLVSMAIILLIAAATAKAQSIRIALDITDQGSSLVTSKLRTALRGLGDVEVVTPEEQHDYLLDGVVVCSPSEDQCTSTAVSLRFSQPFDADISAKVLTSFVGRAGALTARQDSILRTTLQSQTKDYYKLLGLWTVVWGRNVLGSAVSEFVAQLDQRCFERLRMDHRMMVLFVKGDTAAGNVLAAKLYRDPEAAKTALCT